VFGEGEDVFIEHEFFDEHEDKFNWIRWYHDQEWYGRIPFGAREDGLHYDQIFFIKHEEDKAYFIARALNEFDVLMWEKGQEDFTVIKTIIPEASTDFLRVYLRTIFVLPDDKVMLSIGIDKVNEHDQRTNFSYYFNVDQNQLLLPTLTKNVNQNDAFTVFPNPSSGIFYIHNVKDPCGRISIYNALGEKIEFRILNNTSHVLDLSDQPNGLYFITLIPCSGKMSERTIIISR